MMMNVKYLVVVCNTTETPVKLQIQYDTNNVQEPVDCLKVETARGDGAGPQGRGVMSTLDTPRRSERSARSGTGAPSRVRAGFRVQAARGHRQRALRQFSQDSNDSRAEQPRTRSGRAARRPGRPRRGKTRVGMTLTREPRTAEARGHQMRVVAPFSSKYEVHTKSQGISHDDTL